MPPVCRPTLLQCLVGAGEVGARAARSSASTACSSPAAMPPVCASRETMAPRLVKLQLELGGKDPTYVRADADVKAAAESLADGAMYNTGQSCCSVERIYVHDSVHDAFVEHFVATVKGLKVGDPLAEDTTVGAITRAPQLAVLDAQVDDALAQGRDAALRRARVAGPRPLVRAHRVHRRQPHDGTDARGKLRPGHRHPEGCRRRRGRGADERHALRPDGGRVHARRSDGARAAGAGQRRHGLLELLRPRQPAAAVVGPRRFGHRPDAVDPRHPGLHAAQGLAPAPALEAEAHALRPGPHAAARRQRPAVVRVPDGPRRAAARALRGAQCGDGARLRGRPGQRAGLLRLLHRHACRAQRRRVGRTARRLLRAAASCRACRRRRARLSRGTSARANVSC